MKAYVVVTGLLFGLLVVAHVMRITGGGTELARDPFFVTATVIAAALCGWSVHVLRRLRRTPA
jgi:hypothetical protein